MAKKKCLEKNRVITIVIFLVGLLILLYPFISDKWNTWRSDKLLSTVSKKVEKLSDTEKEKIFEEAHTYNRTLVGSIVPDVFAIREGIEDRYYEGILNPCGNGVMGDVEIPKIKVDIPIYHYTSEDVLKEGAGHIFGSSLPVGGENTHCLISAHRGLPSAKMFTDLDLIKKGDHFYLNILGEKLAYEVDKIEIVEPDDTRSLAIERGKDYVTLVTCTPYGINTKRLLVRGHRVSYDDEVYREESRKHTSKWTRIFAKIICIIIGIAIAYLVQKLSRRIKKHKRT